MNSIKCKYSSLTKRDGSEDRFSRIKITNAIYAACKSNKPRTRKECNQLTDKVIEMLNSKDCSAITVEDIQDCVEEILFKEVDYITAKCYVIYRYEHQKKRNLKDSLIDAKNLVSSYLDQSDWRVHENANAGYSYPSLLNHASGCVIGSYTMSEMYPEYISSLHKAGSIHIHDLSCGITGYCAGWSLRDLLLKGFEGVHGRASASPAKHLDTALGQIVNFLFTLQSEWAGAQAFNSVDTFLAPFIRYDNLSYNEVKQAVQRFIFGLNIASRWGQTAFTNLSFDWVVPDDLKDDNIIIGGEIQEEVYGDFKKEMDLFNKAFLEVMSEGDRDGRIFSFPIPTYSLTKDFDWDSENSNLLFKMTAKYGVPYFQNFINSDLNPGDVRSMCCRLSLNLKELRKKTGGLYGAGDKTGCYDDQTEVLTDNGWKLFKDVLPDDKICTLSSESEIEYHKPIQSFVYDYDGELIHFKSSKSDLMVTPNHRMLYANKHNHKHGFVNAEDYSITKHPIPNKGMWHGGKYSASVFELPAIKSEWKSGNYSSNQIKKWDTIAIDMITWVKFLGLWLSEGSVDNINIAPTHGYRVSISQTKEHNLKYIEEILDSMPFKWVYDGEKFIICNKQLWTYMKQFGKQKDRYVPTYVKDLSAAFLYAFLYALWLGDGSVRKTNGQSVYYTTSKQLADDVQELLVKAGYQASMHQRKPRICKIGGKTINSSMICYEVSVRFAAYTYLNDKVAKRVPYRGKVYCLEVPNNTMMVRRNGYTLWCGNSLGVVTINMPQIGYLASDKNDFYTRLSKLMDVAKESLEIKREFVQQNYDSGLLPYTKIYLDTLDRHFNTIGLVGMNEACLNLFNKDITTEEGQEFSVEVLKFMQDRISKYQEETGHIFNLEATPAEGVSYRFALLDKKNFPDIIQSGSSDTYYTNSTQLPVGYTENIFEALDKQELLQSTYTGGTVFHTFLGESLTTESCKKLVKAIATNYRIPYFSITPTFSICPVHGYISGEHWTCPLC